MKLTSGFQLNTHKSYTIKVADGSEPRDLIDARDHMLVKSILSSMTKACDSEADVSFVLDKVTIQSLGVDVYSIDMYVETNTDILIDELNAIMAVYPSRVNRKPRVRTTRRPDRPKLYATRVHIDITTHDFGLVPSRIDICHIYSPAIPLKRNAATGIFAHVSDASNEFRTDPQRFIPTETEPVKNGGRSWADTFGSLFGGASAPPPTPRESTDFILIENKKSENTRPFKRPRVDMSSDQVKTTQ